MSGRLTAGTGLTLTAALGVAGTAQAEDIRVTNLNDSGSGSLRQAVEDANSDTDADRILFKSKLSGDDRADGDRHRRSSERPRRSSDQAPATRDHPAGTRRAPIFQVFASASSTVDVDDFRADAQRTADSNGEWRRNRHVLVCRRHGSDAVACDDQREHGHELADVLRVRRRRVGQERQRHGEPDHRELDDLGQPGQPGEALAAGSSAQDVDLEIRNSTISGNFGVHDGGGVYVLADVATPSFTVRNSTVTGNEAGGSAAAAGSPRGACRRRRCAARSSPATPTATALPPTSTTAPGTSPSASSATPAAPGSPTSGGNLLDVDPLLGGLANNGGPTDTHALSAGSRRRSNNGPVRRPERTTSAARPRKRASPRSAPTSSSSAPA